MSTTTNELRDVHQRLTGVIRKYWGYDGFLPLQQQAMRCVLAGRDSVVVLPTGGGKSLCFQAPAMCLDGLAVVVSPLISLMKDQVDALRACGVPAAFTNSTLSFDERRRVADQVRGGQLKLLYAAPERLVTDKSIEFLKSANVSLIAIDEAHCISSWGHDFRPEYRELRSLREALPEVAVHAYTATASERVRLDVAEQLGLRDAEFLVGSFDRPNLIYKVRRRTGRMQQIREVIGRHPRESGIVYCITRKDVEAVCHKLVEDGYRARPYHAGLDDDERRRNQEDFIADKIDVIVATVAFGMGIDKPDVRYVIHAGMPKSLEHYQQESGRAGRDGMEAECCLFYSGGDYGLWKSIVENSEPEARAGALAALSGIYDFCSGVTCRHRAIVEYFGQQLDGESCGACDVCLGELDLVDDALVIGQKILSCVVRLNQRYGAGHTALVLSGSRDQKVIDRGHDQLSTWGLLADEDTRAIRDWIEQLVGQEFLAKTGEYNVLQVTPRGRRLLNGELTPCLLKPAERVKAKPRKAAVEADSWQGVDRMLFDALRGLRRELAAKLGVPPYIVFGDAALRDIARRRPSTADNFLLCKGVGEKKLRDFGDAFIDCVVAYCRQQQIPTDWHAAEIS